MLDLLLCFYAFARHSFARFRALSFSAARKRSVVVVVAYLSSRVLLFLERAHKRKSARVCFNSSIPIPYSRGGCTDCAFMIKAFIVVNNHAMVRLCRFYEQLVRPRHFVFSVFGSFLSSSRRNKGTLLYNKQTLHYSYSILCMYVTTRRRWISNLNCVRRCIKSSALVRTTCVRLSTTVTRSARTRSWCTVTSQRCIFASCRTARSPSSPCSTSSKSTSRL